MLTTEEEFLRELAVLTREQEEALSNLIRVRDLLERADQRKKDNPSEARNWNKKLDKLEETLLREKSRLARCEQEIRLTRRKLEELKTKPEAAVPDAPGEDATFEEATHQALAHQEKDAVDASLEEAGLVQTALETQEDDSPQDPITRALARRVDHYKSGKSSLTTTESPRSLRRQQHLLREIIRKCNPEQIGTVTLNEIHLVAHCYAIIKERSTDSEEDRRLYEVIEQIIMRLYDQCGPLIELHGVLSKRIDSA
jgi:chromosome segregation ATPase